MSPPISNVVTNGNWIIYPAGICKHTNNWVGKNLNPPTPGTGSVHQLRLDNKGTTWKKPETQSSACLFRIFPDWRLSIRSAEFAFFLYVHRLLGNSPWIGRYALIWAILPVIDSGLEAYGQKISTHSFLNSQNFLAFSPREELYCGLNPSLVGQSVLCTSFTGCSWIHLALSALCYASFQFAKMSLIGFRNGGVKGQAAWAWLTSMNNLRSINLLILSFSSAMIITGNAFETSFFIHARSKLIHW